MKTAKRTIIFITAGVVLTAGLTACNHGMHFGSAEDRGEWMVSKVSKELELNETQQIRLNEVKDELFETRRTMRSDHKQMRADILALLKQPVLDRDSANAIAGRHLETIHSRSPVIIDALGDFYDSLVPGMNQIRAPC